ncbi:MAG: transcriptional regulator [Thermoplasmatota archaeon]
MRPDLASVARGIFARAGYAVSQESDPKPSSFDFVARRDSALVLVKVVPNVDSFAEPWARELRGLSRVLEGAALVIGEKSSSRPLADGAVYMRYGIPILAPATLEEWLLSGAFPLVYAAPGGFYVRIDGKRLRELRTTQNVSLGQLADAVGVSRRAIAMYEDGMGALVAVAEKLERYLDEALVIPVDPLQVGRDAEPAALPSPPVAATPGSELEREALRLLHTLGFDVMHFSRSSISAVGRDDAATVLTGVPEGTPQQMERRARIVAEVAMISETFAAFVVEKKTRDDIQGTAIVSRAELSELDGPEDLVSLIQSRRRLQR